MEQRIDSRLEEERPAGCTQNRRHGVRCDLLPACYVAPTQIRELWRLLRYRNLVVRQAVPQKNKIAGLLMEVGASYNKRRLHGNKYFSALLDGLEEVPSLVKDLLGLSRGALRLFETTQRQLLGRLRLRKPRSGVLENLRFPLTSSYHGQSPFFPSIPSLRLIPR